MTLKTLHSFLADARGATSIEYGAIAMLISVVVLVALNSISGSVQGTYDLIAGAFE